MMKQISDSTTFRWYMTHMEVFNDFTRALDECLVENHRIPVIAGYSDGTYLWLDKCLRIIARDADQNYGIAIRVPGATRGRLIFDPETEQIVDVIFYHSAVLTPSHPIGCYTDKAEAVAQDWIGTSLPDINVLIDMMRGI